MHGFKETLTQKGYHPKTITQRLKDTKNYLDWQAENHPNTKTTYSQLMDYIGYLRTQEKSTTNIKHKLKAIEQYLDYKQADNPVRNIKLRTLPRPKTLLLTPETLDQVYNQFDPTKTSTNTGYYHHSDKLILGLIIYQALDIKDIYRLETEHLNLSEGKIYIKGTSKNNSRILALEPQQILSIHEYQHQKRPQLLSRKASTNYQPESASEKLFTPQSDKLSRMIYQWRKLTIKVKAQTKDTDYEVIRLRQLRQSRIAHWIKNHGLRPAQHMAGFKSISGVERYRQEYLEDLEKQLIALHPLK